jgi:Flp pilus assembly protein TadD
MREGRGASCIHPGMTRFSGGSATPPSSPTALLETALRAIAASDTATAEPIALRVTQEAPQDPRGWWLLGRVRTMQGRLKDADSCLTRAWFLLPNDAEIAAARGHLRLRQGRHAEAAEFFKDALDRRPDHPDARYLRAEALRRDGKPTEALAIAAEAPTALALHVRAKCKADLRDVAGAELDLRDAIAMNPPPGLMSQLRQRLAQVLDANGRSAEAFAETVASRSVGRIPFDSDLFASRLRAIRDVFTPATVKSLVKPTVLTRRPIFLAGLARSGIAILDRLIGAHPRAATGPEFSVLPGLVRSWQDPIAPERSYPAILRTFDVRRIDGVVNAYLAASDEFAGQAERLVDRHLSNWMHLGLIASAFPEATIVQIDRDPMDLGVACFEQLTNAAMPWSGDLESIGRMIAAQRWMMEHWNAVYPGRIVQVRLEELLADPRTHLGRVLDAAGLGWDDACVAADALAIDGERSAVTPSPKGFSEFRDPSVGRAARFSSELAPLKAAIDAWDRKLRSA